MDKLGRNYLLTVTPPTGGPITIQPPFTIEFDIIRNSLRSVNISKITIYNLGKINRDQIRQSPLDYGEVSLRTVQLRAGYGTAQNLPVIFAGNISQAFSRREGVNFITEVTSFDGGSASINAKADGAGSFPKGTTYRNVILALAATLEPFDIHVGTVGLFPGTLPRGIQFSGNTLDVLNELTGFGCFIDNGVFNALDSGQTIADANSGFVVSPETGLLNTPLLENTIVHFDMIFEPRLNVGQLVSIQSFTEQAFNGDYQVTAVKHRGMISEAVCGSVITTGEFLAQNAVGD